MQEILPNLQELSWKEQREEEIQKRVIEFTPRNKNQELFINAINTSAISIAVGPPGTGRSWLSCAVALKLLYEDKVNRIILTRPQVTCEEECGFLPGNESDKLRPYLYPLLDAITDFIGEKDLEKLITEDKIRLASLGLMQGSSFRNSILLLDEGENCTYAQLKMVFFRLGVNCKLVVNGDYSQSNLKKNKDGLLEIIERTECMRDEIPLIQFEKKDVVRSGIVRKLVEIL